MSYSVLLRVLDSQPHENTLVGPLGGIMQRSQTYLGLVKNN